jgi:hypothetical protein
VESNAGAPSGQGSNQQIKTEAAGARWTPLLPHRTLTRAPRCTRCGDLVEPA